MEKKLVMLKKCKVRPSKVGRKRVYGIVESTDRGCQADHPIRKKSRVSEEIVEVGLENTTETVGLPARISQSQTSTDSKNVLRAAMLKTRFAETILKAQEKVTILYENNKAEKARLERKKAGTEADIRAAKIVLQKERQKERVIAGLALENMKETAEWNDALQVDEEFEKLIGCGVVELIDRGCVVDHPMRKKSRVSEEIVEAGHKNKTEIVSLPARISESQTSTDSKNVLRAAMLKTRFAETILKAQEKLTIIHENNKAEKERLERKKADTEADIRAAMMVLQKQSLKEREVARFALENMKQTVEWNDALEVEHELEKLIGVHVLYKSLF